MSRHGNLPHHLYVYVDNEQLGLPSGYTEGIWHGVFAREGQILLSHILLETGAHWTGVPLHAIHHKINPEVRKPGQIQPWGNMGTDIDVTYLKHLDGIEVEYFKENIKGIGTGMVVDWYDGFTRYPEQHKPLHIIAMEDGNYYLLPNNYLRWFDPSFTVDSKWQECKNYKRGNQVWFPENKNNK